MIGKSGKFHGQQNRIISIVKLSIFISILIAIVITIRVFKVDHYLEKGSLKNWISSFGSLAPIAYIILFSITPSLFLPGLPITIAGGIFFGPFWGTIYASIGSTIGACIAFTIGRYFARAQIENILAGKLQSIDEGVGKKGWVFVAITRLIPLFPFNLLNYAFGLTKINFRTYAITSWICMLPGTAAYVIFSSSLFDIMQGRVSKELIIGVVLIVIITSIPVIYKVRSIK